MKVALQLNPYLINKVLNLWKNEHNEYYGQPFGATRAINPLTGELDDCGYAVVQDGGKKYHRWLTSGGNLGLLDVEERILLYTGRRHAVGGLALPLTDLIGLPEDPADWREYRDLNARYLKVLDYQTTEPRWFWWETADDHHAA